jgi:tRNA threonylcarbamoyladenosine biosynthesis protein TsaB
LVKATVLTRATGIEWTPLAVLILAIDTSGRCGSVALLDGPRVLCEVSLGAQRRSAQTLAPAIAEILASERVEAGQRGLVATTVGPGSFTGLRVGVTAAKAFAYAVGAQVIGVSTLEALACGVPEELLGAAAREVQAVVDAQRRELCVGKFRNEAGRAVGEGLPRLRRAEADRLIAAAGWLSRLSPGTVVTGSGLVRIQSELPAEVLVTEEAHWEPRAAVVGRLAWREFQAGRRDDVWKLAPVYLRPSYAEEKK